MKPFSFSLMHLPRPFDADSVSRGFEAWGAEAAKADEMLAHFMHECMQEADWRALLAGIFGNSPFLTHLTCMYPGVLQSIQSLGPKAVLDEIINGIRAETRDTRTFMRDLRIAKGKIALLIAVADISGFWKLDEVTGGLSLFADAAVQCAVDQVLRDAAQRGEITLPQTQAPTEGSGLIVLGMGKLGAFELNYSSDIDLIFFYEPGKIPYRGRHSEREFFRDLVQEVVHILQQRTPDGYVFRTDIRLRPDPSSTPPAVSTEVALRYYESVGQNWERAALIKARPIAGDIQAGKAFLLQLRPFLWRRHLDFAAINDILSIKRQLDTQNHHSLAVPGHNVKIGYGGIREIELFAQVHQLIWGGRQPELRVSGTCEALRKLRDANIAPAENVDVLRDAYVFLRTLEHRLQMVADQQTHALPTAEEDIQRIVAFMGGADLKAFSKRFLAHVRVVHECFISAFRSAEPLGAEGNLVFTGVSHDPDTLDTLRRMGFKHPGTLSEIIMSWHHGSRRCTRTKRARELLTELVPQILKHLSTTLNPDAAFTRFDNFMARIPAGVQLFSLFAANPKLLALIAEIMGNAPPLAESLSHYTDLIEHLLSNNFFSALPNSDGLKKQLETMLSRTQHFEQRMDTLSRFKGEKQFQAGVQLLKGMIDSTSSGQFLARLADVILQAAFTTVETEFAETHGVLAGGRFCVLGLGRLGSRDMTFGSDVDLVFVYDAPDMEAISDGAKSFSASAYYNRLSQRYLAAISAMSRGGRLYEADTRLRPSGAQGLPAVSLSALERYLRESAWTFELMAFTRARAVAGDASLQAEAEALIHTELTQPRDAERLRSDAATMRERVAAAFPPDQPWDFKYTRGGIMDVDFICQYLLLSHLTPHSSLLSLSGEQLLHGLRDADALSADDTRLLTSAHYFLSQLLHVLRLVLDTPLEGEPPPTLLKLLASAVGIPEPEALKARLREVETAVYECYKRILGTPL